MTRDEIVRRGADAYVEFFENLTPESLGEIGDVVADGVRFTDPFNDTAGIEPMRAIFEKMFRDAVDPKFNVLHAAFDGDVCLLNWTFVGRSRIGDLSIDGMSSIRFDDTGRVIEHVDYWDAGASVYQQLPLIGPVIRFIRKRL